MQKKEKKILRYITPKKLAEKGESLISLGPLESTTVGVGP